ncbi:hypothetical protein [Methanothermococcus okinawensis]|uniref:Uncharacterized protein n=1 Tax=Methanothermococcus okinawensis (strain DSM 14208 / JCM 11175 / IH1) TaxID=647113 RepID=F8AKY2_METOI|nr:hypothetical protein [Methanothermococcus okinawensis]AEH06298.1 hypothetical protein Metok_0308 [Methanothermococcus okinawensis IH1]
MALFGGKKVEATQAVNPTPDDLMMGKSDVVEKIAEKKIKEKEYDDVVAETKMRKFYHENTQNEKIAKLEAELAKKDKEIDELKEEIRSIKGKTGGIGIGGGTSNR